MSTPNLDMPNVPTGTLEPSAPINNSLQVLDAVVQLAVEDKDLTAPPTTVADDAGKRWIVGASATGAWTGHDNEIALCTAADLWRFITPTEGWRCDVRDEDATYRYSGSAWVLFASSGSGTAGKHAIPIMAGSMTPSVSGGCAALATIASAANQPDIQTLDFDASTIEYAQFAIPMPKSWNEGTVTAEFRWSHAATTTNFGVVWALQAVAVSNDDTIATNYGTAQTVNDTGGTTNDLYITSETSAITIGGTPAAGDTVYFRVYRNATDGTNDTLAVDARLHSIVLFITTDAENDA